MPPSTAPTRKAARTHTTGTARWRARPAATPPMTGCCVSRIARRTSRRHLARHVVRGQGGGHDASIVAEQHAPDHEEEPRPTPDSRPRRNQPGSGVSPMVYDVPVAHGCPMSTTPPETQPPPTPGPDSGPRVGWDDIRDLGRIRRTTSDRRVAGVAGGLARHLDIDPLIVRVAFVVLTFFGGAGLLLYIACWLLLPEDGSDWGRVALDRRSRTVALVLVGALVLVILAGHTWWGSGYPWALLIVAGIVALVATQLPRRDRRTPAADGSAPATGAVPGDTGSGADARRRPDPDVRRPAGVRRAAAPGQPSQEGPDPLLVRAGRDGRRTRRPRRRRPRRRVGRALGVPGPGAGAERCLPARRRLLGPGRRPHPDRPGGGPGHRRRRRSATSGTRTAPPSPPPQPHRCRAATRSTSASSSSTCPRCSDPQASRRPRDQRRRATSATSTSGSRTTSPSWPTPTSPGSAASTPSTATAAAIDTDADHRPLRRTRRAAPHHRRRAARRRHRRARRAHHSEGACHERRDHRDPPRAVRTACVVGAGGTRSTSDTW